MQATLNSDIEIWLNNKLEGAWSSEKISSLLTQNTLDAVKARFSFLETSIKLKLLFSFVTLGKRMREDLDHHVKAIISTAERDDDEWVEVISKLFSTLMNQDDEGGAAAASPDGLVASSSSHAFQIENDHFTGLQKHLTETCTLPFILYCVNLALIVSDLSRHAVKQHGPPQFWPLEYPYVNSNVADYQSLQGNFNNPHFKLKNKLEEPSLPSTPKRFPQSIPRREAIPSLFQLASLTLSFSLNASSDNHAR